MVTETVTKRPREIMRPCCPATAVPTLTGAEAKRQAGLFKALADPTRLRMLSLLANAGGELCVCHVQEHFDLRQPTISHHLKILRQAGLVRCVKRGIWVYCSLAPEGVSTARMALADLGAAS